MQPPARAWMFHYLADEPAPYAVSPRQLGDFVEARLQEGLTPAPLDSWRNGPVPGTFAITFDDAHRSVLEAVPVLRELGCAATLFVPTAWPDRADWCLTWKELARLGREPGWILGSHGRDHHRMSWRRYRETPAQHARRLADELNHARRELFHRTGSDGALFAYPYGEAPDVARATAAAAGHVLAVTVDDGPWQGDLLRIPRSDAAPPMKPGELDGISVIVPACGRVDVLRETLRRLAAQSYEDFEVLVVDDGSEPPLPDLGVPVLRLPESDRCFRAGQARQLGARHARYQGLCFLDQDVAVGEDFLWAVDYVLRRDVDAVCLGYLSGYNLHDLGIEHTLADIQAAGALTGDVTPVIPDRSREVAFRATLDNVHWGEQPWTLCYTGNLALRRALLDRAGGFADDFTGWGFEDVDLGVRLVRAGARLVPSRWALGYHMVGPHEDQRSNPFRREQPTAEDFSQVLHNLSHLAARHPEDAEVQDFVAQVRADVAETTSRPHTVGIECGGPLPGDWALPSALHTRWPGGREHHDVLDRLAYAEKVGATDLYLLGGDVLARPELAAWLTQARTWCTGRITAETTGEHLDAALAARLTALGLDGVVLELWCDEERPHWESALRAARGAGLTVAAKPVLGDPALARRFVAAHGLDVWDVWAEAPVDWPGATVRTV